MSDVAADPPSDIPNLSETQATPPSPASAPQADSSSLSSSESETDDASTAFSSGKQVVVAPMARFVQGLAAVHIVSMRSSGNGWPVPKCWEDCEKPFQLPQTSEGSGPVPLGMQVCISCRRRLPHGAFGVEAAPMSAPEQYKEKTLTGCFSHAVLA